MGFIFSQKCFAAAVDTSLFFIRAARKVDQIAKIRGYPCMGFTLEALVIHQAIYLVHALLLHSNVRIKFGPLKWLVASPEYHHWHHANERDAYDRNFAAQLPPRESTAGIMPRVVAVVGTFIMSLLIVFPPQAISADMRIISTLIISVGTVMSILCLRQLGRSFSIMATSRALKTQGAYSIVRHPLYAAEVLMIVGVIVGHGTVGALGLGAIWLVLQVRRAQHEESVLRHTFPEYEDYAARVPMLIPGLRLWWLEAPVKPAPEAV